MKVLFVTPSFYPANYYGGPTSVNHELCKALAQREDVDLHVLTTDANGPDRIDTKAISPEANYEVIYCRRVVMPDIAPGLWRRMPRMIRQADIVHLNSVYSFTTIPALVLSRLLRKPVLWSTHGALQRWGGTKNSLIKKFFERICDACCSPKRVVLHTASVEEQAASLERIKHVKATVIPYGAAIPEPAVRSERHGVDLRLLFLGRLHPIKGLENLLAALALAKHKATLAICGQGDAGFEAQLRARVRELNLQERVTFHGYVEGERKEAEFRAADICVVPSFNENFGAVVVESLARGVPVIASRGTPWSQLEQVGCGLWVSNEPVDLAQALDRAALMPLGEMGRRGRSWMQRDFSWEKVAGLMVKQYQTQMPCYPAEPERVLTQAG